MTSRIRNNLASLHKRAAVRELLQQGKSIAAIGKALGISYKHAKNLVEQERQT